LTQTKQAQSVHAINDDAKGVLGRIMDSLVNQDEPYASRSWSVCGQQRIVQGTVPPSLMHPWSGIQSYTMFPELGEQFLSLTNMTHTSLFGETFAGLLQAALLSTEYLKPIIDAAIVSDEFPTYSISRQLLQVAKVIESREILATERDVFVVQQGGYDTHTDLHDKFDQLMTEVNGALVAFVDEMKAKDVWEQVTIVTQSEFGRTLTSNGIGTDHAWAGHQVIIGGSVAGGQMHGAYPSDLSDTSVYGMGRGRFIPTTPWEAMWFPTMQWLSVAEENYPTVLPHLENFVEDTHYWNESTIFNP